MPVIGCQSFILENKRKGDGGLTEAAPHYHGHRERLRGRFRDAGADALSDYELLELLLLRALPRRDVKPLVFAWHPMPLYASATPPVPIA